LAEAGSHDMKIRSIEVLQADAGTRPFSFVKVTTESGLVGWSEFTEAVGNRGTRASIERLATFLIGQDARRVEWAMAIAYTRTIPVWNGGWGSSPRDVRRQAPRPCSGPRLCGGGSSITVWG